jgi:uncharacterized protein YutE (UPF0331/DUF86 family)
MTPSRLREKVITERTDWIRKMVRGVRSLPTASYETFISDPRNTASAESYLRRGLEALLDLGRHVLAKGFGKAVVEYKEISRELVKEGVLSDREADVMFTIAGYRNRMVHFYGEISDAELYDICTNQIDDIELALAAILSWVNAHPEKINRDL